MKVDYYGKGYSKSLEIIDSIDNVAIEIEKNHGTEARLKFELGLYLELSRKSNKFLENIIRSQFDKYDIKDPFDQ